MTEKILKIENLHAFEMYESFKKDVTNKNFLIQPIINNNGGIFVPRIKYKTESEKYFLSRLPIGLALITHTNSFCNWFGDWVNDPENSSRIVHDDSGEPMIVYHGVEREYSLNTGPINYEKELGFIKLEGKQFFTSYKKDALWWSTYLKKGRKPELFCALLNIKNPEFVNNDNEIVDIIKKIKTENRFSIDGIIQKWGNVGFPKGQYKEYEKTSHEYNSDQIIIFNNNQRLYLPFNSLINDNKKINF